MPLLLDACVRVFVCARAGAFSVTYVHMGSGDKTAGARPTWAAFVCPLNLELSWCACRQGVTGVTGVSEGK